MVNEQNTADFFKAIGHPTRINILKTIYKQDYCVNDISDHLHLNQPNTSQHLSILKEKNIISKNKNGNEVCYRIKDPSVMSIIAEAERIIEQLRST